MEGRHRAELVSYSETLVVHCLLVNSNDSSETEDHVGNSIFVGSQIGSLQ